MKSILLCGCNGKMGRVVQNVVKQRDTCQVTAGVDIVPDAGGPFPVYKAMQDVRETPDVLVDFSHPSTLDGILEYAVRRQVPVVLATTGYEQHQIDRIKAAAEEVAVFFTYNMSIGINLLADLAQKAVKVLGSDFDVEIVEKHHNQKIDAPSGTALMLADTISELYDQPPKYEYDRHSKREKRTKGEIGLHAVRGGTIVGEHDIIFAGRDEIITLSHSARSKEIFAVGAVNAALFMCGKERGLYSMKDLVSDC